MFRQQHDIIVKKNKCMKDAALLKEYKPHWYVQKILWSLDTRFEIAIRETFWLQYFMLLLEVEQ